MRLVLLTLLQRDAGRVEIGERREPLNALGAEVAVRHRMPYRTHASSTSAENVDDTPAHRALAAARSHRAHGDHRLRRGEHRATRAEKLEIGAGGEHAAREVHHVLVRDVAVGEDHAVHALVAHETLEILFSHDRDTLARRERP